MINQSCPLVLKDLCSYDIVAAYPTLLSNQYYDLHGVDYGNKEQRNIAIGMEQSGNENLSSYLMNSAEKLVEFYLKENDVADEDVIVTQRDGFILRKVLDNTNEFITMKFRGMIDYLIITPDRNKFLYLQDGVIEVRGVPKTYPALDVFYQKFSNLNFFDKSSLFLQMELFKKSILEPEDKDPFLIDIDGKKFVLTKSSGALEVKSMEFITIEDIDTNEYYTHFFKEFLQSIFLEVY